MSEIKQVCARSTFEDAGSALAEIKQVLDKISDSEDEAPSRDRITVPKEQVVCGQQ